MALVAAAVVVVVAVVAVVVDDDEPAESRDLTPGRSSASLATRPPCSSVR